MLKRSLRFLPAISVLASMLLLTMMIVHAAIRSGPRIPGNMQGSSLPDAPAAFSIAVGDGPHTSNRLPPDNVDGALDCHCKKKQDPEMWRIARFMGLNVRGKMW